MAAIMFRDRLREDSALAAAYSDLKVRLSASFRHDREAYTDGKNEFVAQVVSEVLGKPNKAP